MEQQKSSGRRKFLMGIGALGIGTLVAWFMRNDTDIVLTEGNTDGLLLEIDTEAPGNGTFTSVGE